MKKVGIVLICCLLFVMVGSVLIFKKENSKINNSNIIALNAPSYTIMSMYPTSVFKVPVKTLIIDEGKARPKTMRLIKYVVIHETDNFEKVSVQKIMHCI